MKSETATLFPPGFLKSLELIQLSLNKNNNTVLHALQTQTTNVFQIRSRYLKGPILVIFSILLLFYDYAVTQPLSSLKVRIQIYLI